MKHIKLSNGQYAVVDTEDCLALIIDNIKYPYRKSMFIRWHAKKQGNVTYAVRHMRSSDGKWKTIRMHRFILGMSDWNKKIGVDHINGNGLDNRRDNLRICTQSLNCANSRKSIIKSSRFKGTFWNKRMKKWCAQIGNKKINHIIGYFDSEVKAAKAYNRKAKEFFGEFARLNVTSI